MCIRDQFPGRPRYGLWRSYTSWSPAAGARTREWSAIWILRGGLDSCLFIRTFVIKSGTAYVQAGAGIVADSDPQREYEETERKALALFCALERAVQQEEERSRV